MYDHVASPQLTFNFGTDHVAANDPKITGSPLFKRSRNALYRSLEWASTCANAGRRANFKCENLGCYWHCHRPRRLFYHHIEPVEIRPDLFLVVSNIKCLCSRCHENVTMQHAARHGWAYTFSPSPT